MPPPSTSPSPASSWSSPFSAPASSPQSSIMRDGGACAQSTSTSSSSSSSRPSSSSPPRSRQESSPSHKKRKLHQHNDDDDAAATTTTTMRSPIIKTESFAPRDATGASAADDDIEQRRQRLGQLLAPFSREQLVAILANAAVQHADVLEEITAIASADVAHRKVFVRGLAWETSTEGLRMAFAAFGDVEEGAVIFDKVTGKSRGFGFVTFRDMDAADRAIRQQTISIDGRVATCNLAAVRSTHEEPHSHHHHQGPSGHHLSNQKEMVSHQRTPPPTAAYAMPPQQRPPPPPPQPQQPQQPLQQLQHGAHSDDTDRKLFVRGLAWETTDETLRAEFQKFGELVEAAVVRERKTGKSKGFGFVTFRYKTSADAALGNPHRMIDGRRVTCNLASAGRMAPASVAMPTAGGSGPPVGLPPPAMPTLPHPVVPYAVAPVYAMPHPMAPQDMHAYGTYPMQQPAAPVAMGEAYPAAYAYGAGVPMSAAPYYHPGHAPPPPGPTGTRWG